jgi:tripartite-type tricarboxylate transporter receptor subunit TctC
MDRLYFRAETERPADLAQRLAREYAFWGKVVKQTGYHS